MSKLDDFILASEKRHNFLVSEIQKSEQRTIDELSDELKPVIKRVESLEHSRTRLNGIISGLTVAWAGLLAWLQFAPKIKGGH